MTVPIRSNWFDLPTANPDDTRAFYEGLFGWTFSRLQGDQLPNYLVIQSGKELIGGLRPVPEKSEESTPGPIVYFTVPDLDSYSKRIVELGGTLTGEKVALGKGRGSFQRFKDRERNSVALWAPK